MTDRDETAAKLVEAVRVLIKSRRDDNGALYNERRPRMLQALDDALAAYDAAHAPSSSPAGSAFSAEQEERGPTFNQRQHEYLDALIERAFTNYDAEVDARIANILAKLSALESHAKRGERACPSCGEVASVAEDGYTDPITLVHKPGCPTTPPAPSSSAATADDGELGRRWNAEIGAAFDAWCKSIPPEKASVSGDYNAPTGFEAGWRARGRAERGEPAPGVSALIDGATLFLRDYDHVRKYGARMELATWASAEDVRRALKVLPPSQYVPEPGSDPKPVAERGEPGDAKERLVIEAARAWAAAHQDYSFWNGSLEEKLRDAVRSLASDAAAGRKETL